MSFKQINNTKQSLNDCKSTKSLLQVSALQLLETSFTYMPVW